MILNSIFDAFKLRNIGSETIYKYAMNADFSWGPNLIYK